MKRVWSKPRIALGQKKPVVVEPFFALGYGGKQNQQTLKLTTARVILLS